VQINVRNRQPPLNAQTISSNEVRQGPVVPGHQAEASVKCLCVFVCLLRIGLAMSYQRVHAITWLKYASTAKETVAKRTTAGCSAASCPAPAVQGQLTWRPSLLLKPVPPPTTGREPPCPHNCSPAQPCAARTNQNAGFRHRQPGQSPGGGRAGGREEHTPPVTGTPQQHIKPFATSLSS
jgi:hypothetical protein